MRMLQRHTAKLAGMLPALLLSCAGLFAILAILTSNNALAQSLQKIEKVESGKEISFNHEKGHCLSCHGFPTQPDAEQSGNSGPPIIAMQARFPDKTVLRAKIWDATASHPTSFMPPFGKHKILNDDEIDKVVDFIYSL
jgi:sulfur-oxidizing protein SoxX